MPASQSRITHNIRSLGRRAKLPRETRAQQLFDTAALAYRQIAIGKLPSEILTEILFLVLLSDHKRSLASLGDVSRVWEKVARNSPLLNSVLKFPVPNHDVERALQLAGTHPLHVSYKQDRRTLTKPQKTFLQELGKRANSWAEVDFHVADQPNLDLWQTSGIWAALRACAVVVEDRGTAGPAWNLFGGQKPPRLHHLALKGIPVPWTSAIFADLRTLSITNLPWSAAKPSAQDVMEILSRCPRLTNLTLESTFTPLDVQLPDEEGVASSRPSIMELNEMEALDLRITYNRQDTLTLLSSIKIPLSAQFTITTYPGPPGILVPTFAPYLAHRLANPWSRLVISVGAWNCSFIVLSPGPSFSLTIGHGRKYDPTVTELINHLKHPGRPVTLRFHASFGPDTASDPTDTESPTVTFLDTFADVSEVDTIVLRHQNQFGINTILKYLSSTRPGEGGWPYMKVSELHIQDLCGYKPENVVRLLQKRKIAAAGSGLNPVPITGMTIGAGSQIDEGTRAVLEELLECCSLDVSFDNLCQGVLPFPDDADSEGMKRYYHSVSINVSGS